MSLCYVKTSNGNIGSIVSNSKAKIVCINDAIVVDEHKVEDDDNEKLDKKQNIYNQLQEVMTSKYRQKSRFEKP